MKWAIRTDGRAIYKENHTPILSDCCQAECKLEVAEIDTMGFGGIVVKTESTLLGFACVACGQFQKLPEETPNVG